MWYDLLSTTSDTMNSSAINEADSRRYLFPKRIKIDPESDEDSDSIEERLDDIFTCVYCFDTPRNSIYQVSWNKFLFSFHVYSENR